VPKWYVNGMPTLWLRLRNRVEGLFRWSPLINVLEPEIVDVWDAHKVLKWLREFCPKADYVFLSDEKYQICTKQSFQKFLELDETDRAKYIAIWHDCDDFSYRLMGQFHRGKWACLAFGIAWSSTHAYNILIAQANSRIGVFIIEPQTDAIFSAQNQKKHYETRLIIM